MTELEKLEKAAEQLRELIREANGATKDLLAATKGAKSAYHSLTSEALHTEWEAAQAEIARAFKHANDRGVKEIDGRISRMIKYLTSAGMLSNGQEMIDREERTGFMVFGHTNDGSIPEGSTKL